MTGTLSWDYIEHDVFDHCGTTGAPLCNRRQLLTGRHLAHAYLSLAAGSDVDAVRHLDKGSPEPKVLGKNPGRAFIDAPGDGGFATAPDLVRFAHVLGEGTLLDRSWADVLTAAKVPHRPASFGAYGIDIVAGQWMYQRAGGNPGIGVNWSSYRDTGWAGVILSNGDGVPLREMIGRENYPVTGAAPGDGVVAEGFWSLPVTPHRLIRPGCCRSPAGT